MEKIDKLIAAKSDRNNTSKWLPLWMHHKDTAGIMEYLIEEWLPLSVIDATGLHQAALCRIGRFLGGVHDIGKLTPYFQRLITKGNEELLTRILEAGFCIPHEKSMDAAGSPHALASEVILLYYDCPETVACVVGAHHGKPQSQADAVFIEAYPNNYHGKENPAVWTASWERCIADALAYAGFTCMEDLPSLSMPAQMLLTGLLIMADWIASNVHYFPLISTESVGIKSLYPERVERAWERLGLTQPWESACYTLDEQTFAHLFGFSPNTVQQAVLETAETSIEPGIYILEAQMGVGKTEAALAAAEVLAAKKNCGGLFFGLPTQATANGIFPRLEDWAKKHAQDTVHAIRLAHGMASFNEQYHAIFEGNAIVEEDDFSNGLIVHNWFAGRKQALLAEFVIGTVDQVLMAALKQKHMMLRHLGLAGKVVILDECHAYDAYMNQYLDRTLEWLGSYHVPVIILSATLPAQRRIELVKAYLQKRTLEDWCDNIAYPLLTWTDGGQIFQKQIPTEPSSRTVHVAFLSEHALVNQLRDLLSEGGCAAIIVNTVQRAQKIAALLYQELPEMEILLNHAQYLMPDRLENEKTLLERLGKKSTPELRNRVIAIGTQVMEQSLDFDADVLITDLCPMDLLLQRMGRLHRHNRKRPPALSEAACLVLTPEDGSFEKGAAYIYGEWLLMKTKDCLSETILLPQDIPALVQAVYQKPDTAQLDAPYRSAWDAFEKRQAQQKERAKAFRMMQPDLEDDSLISGCLDADIGIGDAKAEAAVRDGDPSVEVLLLMEKEAHTVGLVPWQDRDLLLTSNHVPPEDVCRKIARQRLRLPTALCRPWLIDNTIEELERRTQQYFAEWMQSPWLNGELILLLNNDLTTELSGFHLRYDRQKGLQYIKEGAELERD